MESSIRWLAAVLLCLAVAGCGDDDETNGFGEGYECDPYNCGMSESEGGFTLTIGDAEFDCFSFEKNNEAIFSGNFAGQCGTEFTGQFALVGCDEHDI